MTRRFARACAEVLREAYDLQRLTARVATGRASPRDLRFLANTLALLPRIKAKLCGRKAPLVRELEAALDLCADVRAEIEALLVDDPPLSLLDGGDGAAGLPRGARRAAGSRPRRQRVDCTLSGPRSRRTGISGLKIGFNKVFGYYLELTAAQVAKAQVPADYIRKQTLKNQERFITPQLKEHEDKVLKGRAAGHQPGAGAVCGLRGNVGARGRG